MSSTSEQPANSRYIEDDTIDLGELIRGLLEQWRLIVGLTVLGAITGVAIALILPKQYRVEAIVNQPSQTAVQPLLAQTIAPVTLEEITTRFLFHVSSFNVLAQAFENADFYGIDNPEDASESEITSRIQSIANELEIKPVRYEFYQLSDEERTPLDTTSISLLGQVPTETKRFIEETLKLAEARTLEEIQNRIEANKAIQLEQAQTAYDQLLEGAESRLRFERRRLRKALNTANALGIQEPTSWETLVLENTQFQMINQLAKDELFLNGSRFLTAQLDSLSEDGAAELYMSSFDQRTVDGNGDLVVITKTPSELQGEIQILKRQVVDITSVSLLDDASTVRVPANSEKPNRPLIAIASTVLAGFAALFLALIRMAIRNKN